MSVLLCSALMLCRIVLIRQSEKKSIVGFLSVAGADPPLVSVGTIITGTICRIPVRPFDHIVKAGHPRLLYKSSGPDRVSAQHSTVTAHYTRRTPCVS